MQQGRESRNNPTGRRLSCHTNSVNRETKSPYFTMASLDFSGNITFHQKMNVALDEEEFTASTSSASDYQVGLTAADFFYARMNNETLVVQREDEEAVNESICQALSRNNNMIFLFQKNFPLLLKDYPENGDKQDHALNDEDIDFPCDSSFANLEIPDIISSPDDSNHSISESENPSNNSGCLDDSNRTYADLQFPDNSAWADGSNRSVAELEFSENNACWPDVSLLCPPIQTNESLLNNGEETDGALLRDVKDIEEYLLEILPPVAKSKISAETWRHIFRQSSGKLEVLTKECKIIRSSQEDSFASCDYFSVSTPDYSLSTASTPPDHATKSLAGITTPVYNCSIKEERSLKSVRFDYVQVRKYERVLSNNPAVTDGAGIGIGWRYRKGRIYSVDEWEERRLCKRSAQTSKPLTRQEREQILKYWGYTQKDLAVATRSILKAKNKRKNTIQRLGYQSMEESMENTTRGVKNLLNSFEKTI